MKFETRAQIIEWALKAPHLWLFLDYDGTLADFAPTPDYIESSPEITDMLDRLGHRSNIRVTVLSGRRLQHLRLLLPVSGIFLAGTYGIELLTAAGETIQRVEYGVIRPALETIKPQWAEAIRGRHGFFLEDKGWTLALHARFAEDEEAERVLAQALQIASAEIGTDHFRVLGGHKFLEIAPRLASKKETVAYLLRQYPLPEARLLYIGDDDKDEEAFSLIHARQGIALKIRQPSQAGQPTEADFFLQSPADTLHWLSRLL
jgi:trehalose 6-phosphate phosphatase